VCGRWVEAVTGKVCFSGGEVRWRRGRLEDWEGWGLAVRSCPTRPRPPPPWRTFVSDGPSESPEGRRGLLSPEGGRV
jgi:hypothetical protein